MLVVKSTLFEFFFSRFQTYRLTLKATRFNGYSVRSTISQNNFSLSLSHLVRHSSFSSIFDCRCKKMGKIKISHYCFNIERNLLFNLMEYHTVSSTTRHCNEWMFARVIVTFLFYDGANLF